MADTTREELIAVAKTANGVLTEANKAFQALRAEGSAADLVTASQAVVKSQKAFDRAQHEADTFELIGVYENVRKAVLLDVVKAGVIDVKLLAKHDVSAVTITIPVSTEGPVDPDKIVVNTLGKRTVVKSGNGGSRTRYVYGPEKLNSRQLVEQFGADEVGAEKSEATLENPSKFGLTHLADRIAKKLDFDKVPA